MPQAAGGAGERHEGLNLAPPAEGFELYRHKNADETRTGGWSGLYWARRDEEGDYEIRAVTREGEAHYEKVGP
jgi:hypothetical protein